MDYGEYEAEDFLLDPSFREYCLGKNEEAVKFWEQWMTSNPGRQNAIRQARQLYALLNGNHSVQAFREDEKTFRARFAAHLGEDKGEDEEPPAKSRNWYYAGAAALAAASIFSIIFFTRRPPARPLPAAAPSPAEYVQTSKAGERKSFQLPDGSKVMLNAGSSLRIPAGFNRTGREIFLEGEAFFDVARDAARPFVIHTRLMDIKVLGTVFNIKAYPGDPLTETSLLTGSVEVLVKDGRNQKFILHPHEKIVVPNNEKIASRPDPARAKTHADHYKIEKLRFARRDSSLVEISWTESRLAFNDDSFEAIALQLERWYNVSIRFEDESLKQFRFTGVFDKKTIEQVLNALQLSRPFTYRIEEDGGVAIGNTQSAENNSKSAENSGRNQ
jgi:transmembrane sensor